MQERTGALLGLIALAAMLAATVSSATAQTGGTYEWSKLTISIGSTPSGGFDSYGRLLSRHIGKYLPGRPHVIVSNKPGAGGLIAYNYIYNLAPKDGTEIATSAPGNIIDRLLTGDKTNARFEPEKLNWLGTMNKDNVVFIVAKAKQITLKDILAGWPVEIGMAGPGGNAGTYGRALNEFLGLKLHLVAGYPGMAEVLLAFERGELDGIPAANWESMTATRREWFTSGKADVILQYGTKRLAEWPNVPIVDEILTRDEDRQAMNVFTKLEVISRPFFTAPDVPAERVEALRRAFEQAMRDPELIEAAKRMNLGANWASGQDVAGVVREITNPSEAAYRKIRSIARVN